MDNKIMLTGHPFDDLRSVIGQLPEADSCSAKKIQEMLGNKPLDADGGFSNLLKWLGKWQGTAAPTVAESHICILSSSYEGQDSQAIGRYVESTAKGAAAVNLLCVDKGIGLRALQLAPELPHVAGNWEASDCMAAVAFGMEATASGGDILGLADVAGDNAPYALAVILAIRPDLRELLADVPGIEATLVDEAKEMLGGEQGVMEPLEALRCFGGREIAASVGAIVAARSRRLPVIAEGWGALAAIVVLEACAPGASDHVWPASFDHGIEAVLWQKLGRAPMVGTAVGLGPGCGAALALTQMASVCSLLSLRDQK